MTLKSQPSRHTFALDELGLEHGVEALWSEKDNFVAISEFLQSFGGLSVGEPKVLAQSVGSLRGKEKESEGYDPWFNTSTAVKD